MKGATIKYFLKSARANHCDVRVLLTKYQVLHLELGGTLVRWPRPSIPVVMVEVPADTCYFLEVGDKVLIDCPDYSGVGEIVRIQKVFTYGGG